MDDGVRIVTVGRPTLVDVTKVSQDKEGTRETAEGLGEGGMSISEASSDKQRCLGPWEDLSASGFGGVRGEEDDKPVLSRHLSLLDAETLRLVNCRAQKVPNRRIIHRFRIRVPASYLCRCVMLASV